ncbi:hypothetical protein LINPERPRIM_LOCUS5021 [Linum perenne]
MFNVSHLSMQMLTGKRVQEQGGQLQLLLQLRGSNSCISCLKCS